MKKLYIILFFLFSLNISNIYSDVIDWYSNDWNYRLGIKLTKPEVTENLNYQYVPIETVLNFSEWSINNIDSSSIRVSKEDGLTIIPSQTEEWTDVNLNGNYDTCLLIFQIDPDDLNDNTDTTVEYFIYFDELITGIKGDSTYATDLSYTLEATQTTLENDSVSIIIGDNPNIRFIYEKTQAPATNLTQGSATWRQEGMYEIEEGVWRGLWEDDDWVRTVDSGPVRLMVTGTNIQFNDVVDPPRVALIRKWKIYRNYSYFFIEDRAEVINGPINVNPQGASDDEYWKYCVYTGNLPNIRAETEAGVFSYLSSATNVSIQKPYWLAAHSANFGRAVLIRNEYFTNNMFSWQVAKDNSSEGLNPNRLKLMFVNGETGDVTHYEFPCYVYGHAHSDEIIRNEYLKWQHHLQKDLTMLYHRNPQISNITLSSNSLRPNKEMPLRFDVLETDGFNDIDTITITVYHTGLNTLTGADSELNHATFKWLEETDEWLLVGPLGTTWAINTDSSVSPGTGSDTTVPQTMKLVFTPGKTAIYDTESNWQIHIEVESQNQRNNGTGAINVSCDFYSEIIIPPNDRHDTFQLNNPNSQGNPLVSPVDGFIDLTFIANGPFYWGIEGNNFVGAPEGLIDINIDTYLLTNLEDNITNAKKISTSFLQIEDILPSTTEAGINRNLYLWFNYPWQASTLYTSNLNIFIKKIDYTNDASDSVIIYGQTTSGSVPVIGPLQIFTDDSGGTENITDTLTPNDEMTLLIPISDNDGFMDLDTVTIHLWNSISDTIYSPDSARTHAAFQWLESSDSWSLIGPLESGWKINTIHSSSPGSGVNSSDTHYLKLVFIPGKAAKYSSALDWNIVVSATSLHPSTTVYSDTLHLHCDFYSEIKVAPRRGVFLQNDTESIFNPLISPPTGKITVSYISNATFNLSVKGYDFTSDSGLIYIDSSDSPLKYNIISDTATSDSITTDYKNIISNISATSINFIDTDFYLWLDYPETSAVDFSGTVVIAIENTGTEINDSYDTIYLSGRTLGGPDDPKILSIKLYTYDSESELIETNNLTPGEEMEVIVSIQEDANGFDDIDTVTFYFFHNSCTQHSEDSPVCHATYQWSASNDSWYIIGPLNTGWQIDTENCFAPAGSASTEPVNVKLVFTASTISLYDMDYNWNILVTVQSATQANDGISFINVNNNFYASVFFMDESGTFVLNNPNSDSNPLIIPASNYLSCSIVSNYNYDIYLKAENFTGGSGIILSQDNPLGTYYTDNPELKQNVRTSYALFRQNQLLTVEEGDLEPVYLWLDYGPDSSQIYSSNFYLRLAPTGENFANFQIEDSIPIYGQTNTGSNPVVSPVELFSDASGGTTTLTNTLTPNEEMTLLFYVQDDDTIRDIEKITVYFWDSVTVDSDSENLPANHASYRWSPQTGEWSLLGPLNSTWKLNHEYSTGQSPLLKSSDSEMFKLVFTPGKISNYRNDNEWKIVVEAVSYSPGEGVYSEILSVNNQVYAEMILIDTYAVFNTGQPLSQANTISYPYDNSIKYRIITNSTIELNIKADNFTGGGGININVGEPLTYDFNVAGSYDTNVTTAYDKITDVDATNETGIIKTLYFRLDYPDEWEKTYATNMYINADTAGFEYDSLTISLYGYTSSPSDPYVRSIQLYSDSAGGTTTPTTSLTPGQEMTLAAVITDEDGFDDLNYVDFIIWNIENSSLYGNDNAMYHATYRWTRDGDLWELLGPAGTSWEINVDSSVATDPYPYDNNFNTVLTNEHWSSSGWSLSSSRYTSSPSSASSGTGNNINNTLTLLTNYPDTSQLTFRWYLNSELNFDFLSTQLNGSNITGFPISGNRGGFHTKQVEMPPGENTILWGMTTDDKFNFENAYIDDVTVRPNSHLYNFKLVFTPGKTAFHSEDSKWRIDVIAVSKSQTSNGTFSSLYNCDYYSEITVSENIALFDTGSPGSLDNPLINNFFDVNIISNYYYDLGFKCDDFTGGSGISLNDNVLGIDLTATNNHLNQTYIRTDLNYLYFNELPTSEEVIKKIYLWLDYPNDSGTVYNSTFTMAIRKSGASDSHAFDTVLLYGQTFPFPPSKPTGLDAVAILEGADTGVLLSWNHNSDPDTVGYNIYRTFDPLIFSDTINLDLISDTNYFLDKNVVQGEAYFYKIVCVDIFESESEKSDSMTASSVKVKLSVDTYGRTLPGDTLTLNFFYYNDGFGPAYSANLFYNIPAHLSFDSFVINPKVSPTYYEPEKRIQWEFNSPITPKLETDGDTIKVILIIK